MRRTEGAALFWTRTRRREEPACGRGKKRRALRCAPVRARPDRSPGTGTVPVDRQERQMTTILSGSAHRKGHRKDSGFRCERTSFCESGRCETGFRFHRVGALDRWPRGAGGRAGKPECRSPEFRSRDGLGPAAPRLTGRRPFEFERDARRELAVPLRASDNEAATHSCAFSCPFSSPSAGPAPRFRAPLAATRPDRAAPETCRAPLHPLCNPRAAPQGAARRG